MAGSRSKKAIRGVALNFSGGFDSRLAAIRLSREFDLVHLVSYDTGAELLRQHSADSARLVQQRVRAPLRHFDIDISGFWRQLVFRNILGLRYVCALCKLAMHTHTIIHCVEHGLHFAADGSNRHQDINPEQMASTLDVYRGLYDRYGIEFLTPVYELSGDDEDRQLAEAGVPQVTRVNFGLPGVKGQNWAIQPICMLTPLTLAATRFPGWPLKEEVAARLVRDNLDKAIPYIEKRISRTDRNANCELGARG
jgi:predicted subunit of tRNA(5-methylaminomethyl-2-thiouridylate) methyltransferase